MCGIAGFIDGRSGYSAEALARTAEAMATTLRHRGPDDAGVWTDPVAGVALAHRRLSIVDLSPAGHQPMVSSCGRLVLSYNGEIYNHAELRAELAASGRTFRGHSDTEVLVEACAAWGVEATLRRLIGMFAFAVWDRAARTMTLARDRIGLKPLFWGQFGPLFLFGSELKALRAHPGWTPEIDRGSLGRLHAVGPRSLAVLHPSRPAQAAARPFPGPDSPRRAARLELLGSGAGRRRRASRSPATGRRGGAGAPRGAARRRRRPPHDRRRAPGRFPFGRDRFGVDRGPHAGALQPAGEHLRHRLRGEALRRGGTRAGGGEAPGHRPCRDGGHGRRRADARPGTRLLVRRAFRHPLPDPRHDGLAAGPPRGDGGPVRRRRRRAVRRLSRLPHRPGRAWGDRRSGARRCAARWPAPPMA